MSGFVAVRAQEVALRNFLPHRFHTVGVKHTRNLQHLCRRVSVVKMQFLRVLGIPALAALLRGLPRFEFLNLSCQRRSPITLASESGSPRPVSPLEALCADVPTTQQQRGCSDLISALLTQYNRGQSLLYGHGRRAHRHAMLPTPCLLRGQLSLPVSVVVCERFLPCFL